MIDHLVYAAADLPSASAAIAERLGVEPTPGGSHPGRGTYNELLALGGATYLEIIGPDPQQSAPDGPRPFGIDSLVDPALVAWCVRPLRPLAEIVAAAQHAGIDFGGIAAMSRRRPDGVVLEWELTFPQLDGPFGGALPFLIDWGRSAHPTDTLVNSVGPNSGRPNSVRLIGFDVVHPQPDILRIALDIIGITGECNVRSGRRSALAAHLSTPRGEVTLSD